MKSEFKTKIIASWMQELERFYFNVIGNWISQDGHDELLFEHALFTWQRINKQLQNRQNKYTLSFDSREAIAFMQTCMRIPTAPGTLIHVIIQTLIGQIDKTAANNKKHGKATHLLT